MTITDSFTRADSLTSLGSSSDGWSWTAVNGTWGIDTNRGKVIALGAGNSNATARAESDLGSAAHYSQVTLTQSTGGNNNNGACTRFAAAANTFYAYINRSTHYQLFKCVAGAFTLLATGSASVVSGDVVKLQSDSSDLHSAFLNGSGVADMTHTDTAIPFSGGNSRAGIMGNNNFASIWFDDFSAAALGGGVTVAPPGLLMANRAVI